MKKKNANTIAIKAFQERKQEQLLTFSRSISSLQQKARETRYKNRLEKMEGKTMSMLTPELIASIIS